MTALATVPRETTEAEGNLVLQIPIDQIDVGDNVRVNVDGIDELAESIKAHGLKQPIKVRASSGRWVVVWGQRRLLAHRLAGIERIPAIIADEAYTPGSLAIEQLVENLHRVDLPPLDRARAMRTVVDAGTSQADLARELGLHPSTIANDLGLLEAPAAIQASIEKGDLSPAHAKALKGLPPKTQVTLAKQAIEYSFSAHRLEEEVQRERRSEEAQRERAAHEAEQRKRNQVEIEASIAQFENKKVPKDAVIVVAQDYYGQGTAAVEAIAELIRKAGYANARASTKYGDITTRPTGGVCDCTAWKAAHFERGSYEGNHYVRRVGISIVKGCTNRQHEEAKTKAANTAQHEKYAQGQRVQERIKQTAAAWPVPGARAIAIDRILAEALLWDVLGYRLPEWSVARGGKRNTAWTVIHELTDEDLAAEVAKGLADDFRDKAGYHVDWAGLAVELGLTETTA